METGEHESQSRSMFDVVANDPDQLLIDRTGIADEDVAQISEVMTALGDLREAEARLSAASRRYMKLNETDMRAIHFLIVTSLAESSPRRG